MKKKFFKSFVAFAAVAVVGLGSYKAHEAYMASNMSEEDLFFAENVLALSEDHSSQRQIAKHTVYRLRRYVKGYAWDIEKKKNVPVYGYKNETSYYQTCNSLGEKEAQKYPVCENGRCTNFACAQSQGWSEQSCEEL